MDVSSIQSGMTSSLASSVAGSEGLGKEDFLKLLVAQLAHQDPLQPMENTEFVAQLAQFSNLEQLMGVNSNLGLLQVSQSAMTNSQITGLIGKEVEAKGDMLQLLQPGPADVNFDLPATATEVTVKIRDSQNNLIRSIDVGQRSAGLNSVTWDGRDSMGNQMPAGTYSVEVGAKDSSGNQLAVSSRFKGVVTGVTYKGGVPLLEIGTTTLPVGDVLAVRQYSPTTTTGGP